jgi:predicted RNase H-like nuclease (RuvC/YqgF family)
LISDYIKLYKEYEYEKTEKEKYKKEARELREVTKSQAEDIASFGKEIELLSKATADLEFEIAQLQGQFAEVSRERDSLLDCCKGYEVAVPKLNAKINDLETKLISQNPLKDYSAKELLNAFFDKIFRR